MKNSENILKKIKSIVLHREPSAKIYLYGSRARGSQRKDSDWDLLIIIPKEKITPEMEEEITHPLYDLEFDTGEIISPMVYSQKKWNSKYKVTPLYNNIMKEGVLL